MRALVRVVVVLSFCVVAAGGGVVALLWSAGSEGTHFRRLSRGSGPTANAGAGGLAARTAEVESAATSEPDIDPGRFEDGGFGLAVQFTGPIKDLASLAELRSAIRARGPAGSPPCVRTSIKSTAGRMHRSSKSLDAVSSATTWACFACTTERSLTLPGILTRPSRSAASSALRRAIAGR